MPWVPQPGERFRSPNIDSLFGARDGSLYIGTDNGLARITGRHLYNYPEAVRYPGPFSEDAQGTVWMGDFANFTGSSTLCRIGMEHLDCLGTKDGFDCVYGTAVMSERAGSVWVGSKEGICHWQQGKKPENFPLPYLSRPNINSWVLALASTGAGALWAGIPTEGDGYGLLTFSAGRWQSYVTPEVDGTKLPVDSLLSDTGHSLWIGTVNKGLYRLSAGKLERFDTADGLSGNDVEATFEDREGDLWVVTGHGLDMFRDLPVISYSTREGLPEEQPRAIAAQDDGTVWIGGKGALVGLRNNTFSSITPKNGLPASDAHYLYNDSHNQLWVAGGQQLFLYKDHRFVAVLDHGTTDIGWVAYMTEDRNHQLWVSVQDSVTGRCSILRVVGSRVAEKYDMFVPTGGKIANAMAADPDGGLWLGGYPNGLFRFHNGAFERVDAGGFNAEVDEMTVDPDGAVWVITKQDGLLRYKAGKAQYLTSRNGLPCDAGFDITRDHAGNHWFYMACGIAEIRDTELAQWWKDPTHHVKTTLFGLIDGAEPQPMSNSPVVTPDGRIWSVTRSSLQVIDPSHLPYNSLAPLVDIQRFVVDHKDQSVNGAVRLSASPREVEIDYAALSYVVPEEVQFRYKLSVHDTELTDAGTRRQAFYNNLSPGRYTFHVIACNNDGVWNRSGTSITFTIPPAWYQTVWFRFLCVALAVFLAYTLYQSRLRRYAALLKARFDERIEERTRLARDLHDTLLQTLQGSKLVADDALEEPTDNVRMRKALDLVSQWLERASVEGRAALNSLRSSTLDTNDLAAAFRNAGEDCRIGSSVHIDYVLNGISSDMHPIVRDEIYRIGYEAIKNACLHSGGSVVTIELTYSHNVLLCVRDNGRGIDERTVRFGKDGHFGLEGMRERADRIGAKLLLKTALNHGTELTLLVPGSVVFKTYNSQHRSKLAKHFARKHDLT